MINELLRLEGSRFPTGGYAYMDRFQDWLKI
jgi:urease accessory protein UreF